VPSYLSFKDRADKSAAQANVRAVLPDVESYNADNVPGGANDPNGKSTSPGIGSATPSATDNGYTGMSKSILTAAYDQAFPSTVWVNPTDTGFPANVTGVVPAAPATYCVLAQSGNWYAWKLGPGGSIQTTSDPALACK
jgi:hypothetical protein